MITLIGTPPNLIVSNYRFEATGEALGFFSFASVGITVFLAGTAFMMLFGKYLIPKRKAESHEGLFDMGHYLSEVEVVESSKMVGESIFAFYSVFKIEVEVLSIIRNKRHIIVPSAQDHLRVGDVLMGPVAVSLVTIMNDSPDPLLVSVAITSTTAFITPIAHQSNMLVMGPGGYQFRDYWKLGLALSILSITISVPLIVRIWPL